MLMDQSKGSKSTSEPRVSCSALPVVLMMTTFLSLIMVTVMRNQMTRPIVDEDELMDKRKRSQSGTVGPNHLHHGYGWNF